MEKKDNQSELPRKNRIAEQVKETEKTVVYMGPGINGVIQHGTVLINKGPGSFEEMVKKYSLLRGLLVSADRLMDVKKELAKPDSEMNMLYKQAAQILGGNHV